MFISLDTGALVWYYKDNAGALEPLSEGTKYVD
jgi:hypothetical protein